MSREEGEGRILIVEDESLVAMALELFLAEKGYEVCGIMDTADGAVHAAGIHRPDLILMDIRLRGERDGVDAATEIHTRFGIRSIFVSAYSADREIRRRAETCDPLGFLSKPWSPDLMERTLEKALRALGDTAPNA